MTINKIRAVPHFVAVIVLLLAILPAMYFPYAIHSIRFNYRDQGFSNMEGMLWRLMFYCIAVIMGMAIINLVPEQKLLLSEIGKNSLLVYVGSTFLSPSAYILFEKFFNISQHRILNFCCMMVFCATIVFIMSRKFVFKIYNWVISVIISVLFKEK